MFLPGGSEPGGLKVSPPEEPPLSPHSAGGNEPGCPGSPLTAARCVKSANWKSRTEPTGKRTRSVKGSEIGYRGDLNSSHISYSKTEEVMSPLCLLLEWH